MTVQIKQIPFADDLIDAVAAAVEALPGGPDARPDVLVLLPSQRACRQLGHRLLERAGGRPQLLPRCLTPQQWEEHLAAGWGLDLDPQAPQLPDDRFRAQILAPLLHELDWPQGAPPAGPGLAAEYIAFFDELRRQRVDGQMLQARDLEPVLQRLPAAEADIVRDELERARLVWRLYRRAVPRDRVDAAGELADRIAAGQPLPAPPPRAVLVAGLGRADAVRAIVLRATLAHGRQGLLMLPSAEHPLDHRLCATWGRDEAATDPLAATRRLRRRLLGDDEPVAAGPDAPLMRRLASSPTLDASAAPGQLVADTPEAEAAAVAEHVAAWLETHGAPPRGIIVATADPELAARVKERLADVGLDSDNTVGRPLAAWPAGLLLRFLLRAALTDLRAEPLLEVLTNPYASLAGPDGKTGVWALRLERMFRREAAPQSGLVGLLRKAAEHDEAATAVLGRQTDGMLEYVRDIEQAFAPLLAVSDGRAHPWFDLLAAVEQTWRLAAPERSLASDPRRPDLTRLFALLAALRRDADRLAPVTLAQFAGDLGRLLTGETVAAHRAEDIAVTVTGLVEARLARADLLVVAGLNEGVFPAPGSSPALLPGPARVRLELPTWRDRRAQESELFLRLLHAAPAVTLSWSRNRGGQPALPSSLLQRLQLAAGLPDPQPAPAPLRRREAPPAAALATAEDAFRGEPAAAPRHAPGRPLDAWSWSGLRNWRDCPYRALLERGFALRAEETVREEFGAKEYGSVVHEVLQSALAPDHACYAALASGRREAAATALAEVARARFLPGAADLPERKARLRAFLDLAPGLIEVEARRFVDWRPLVREQEFTVTLADLHAWAEAAAAACGLDPAPPLPGHAAAVTVRGTIDRVDRAQDGTGGLFVLDYKTGSAPSAKHISALEDLQLLLYAAVVEMGAVPGAAGPVVHAAYYGLDPKGRPGPVTSYKKLPVVREDDGPPRLVVEGAQALVALAADAADPAAVFPLLPRARAGTQEGPLLCRWCDMRGVCRVEERDLGPAVALKVAAVVSRKEDS